MEDLTDAMQKVDLLVHAQVAQDTRNRVKSFQMAGEISAKIINATPANLQTRFKTVDAIIAAYNVMMLKQELSYDSNLQQSPSGMEHVLKDPSFCTFWIKLHDRLVDKFYVDLAEAPFRRMRQSGLSVTHDDAFSNWGPPCEVILDIDPKKQEIIEKNRVPRRSRLTVTRDMVRAALADLE